MAATATVVQPPKTHTKTPTRPAGRADSTGPYALIKRRAWDSKDAVLSAGSAVQAFSYQRTSSTRRGSETSVGDQELENSEHIGARSWVWADSFTDNNKSASRHGKKVRTDMVRLKAAIEAGLGDVLVLCEVTRQTRQLREFADLVETCRLIGFRWWYVGGVLYDLEDENDQLMLGLQAMLGQREAEVSAKRTRRAMKGAARRGRPHAKCRYGYVRRYDRETGDLISQVPDEGPRRYVGELGCWVGSHASVVRWIFAQWVGGAAISEIRSVLIGHGVPTPSGGEYWAPRTIRDILDDESYTGVRLHKGEVTCEDAMWEELVSAEVFATARAMRSENNRRYAPAIKEGMAKEKVVTLLAGIDCGVCGGRVHADSRTNSARQGQPRYRCARGCVTAAREMLDAFVLKAITEELGRDRWRRLYEPYERPEAAGLRTEAETVRGLLADWKAAAEQGDVGPKEYKEITAPLRVRLANLEARARQAATPAILAPLMTAEDAAKTFLALDVNRQRQILQACTTITLNKATKRGRGVIDTERVNIEWVTADDLALAT